jgi:uncharacterized protein YciI
MKLAREYDGGMRHPLALAVLLCSSIALAETPAASQKKEPAFQLEKYELVFLRRPKEPKQYPQPELERIQSEHLEHLGKMARAGKLVVAGPLGDQADESLRGICLYRTGSLDEARKLAENDPAVKAGRLAVEVMTWYTQKGALAFPVFDSMQKK